MASARPRVYLATAQALDDEMRAKIARHKKLRGPDWQTLETRLDIGPPLSHVTSEQVVLLDCATMWLSNHLLAESDLDQAHTDFLNAIASCPAPLIVVSNEVGLSVVPDNDLARHFRNAQGRLNQTLAAQADLVVNVIAGLPQVLKGTLP